MNFSERMADLFVHGQLVADLMEDGTKAILALAAVSVANIFWTEQQESQRVKRIRDYSDLIRVRDAVMASPDQQIGILPLSFIQERISHLETTFHLPTFVPGGKIKASYGFWDFAFSMAPGILLLFFGIVGMFTDTFAGATTPLSAIIEALAACIITIFLLHYI